MTEQIMTSDKDTWMTPPAIWERALQVMGKIDLDPASDDGPEFNIPARVHYTKKINGLSKPWWVARPDHLGVMASCVFMNPPYNKRRDQGRFVRKLLQEHQRGHVEQAIVLIAARTETQWFRDLADYPRCFVWGRLHFLDPFTREPTYNSATFPSAVFGLGVNLHGFWSVFRHIGDVYVRYGG